MRRTTTTFGVTALAVETDEAADIRWSQLTSVPSLRPPAHAVKVSDALATKTASRAQDGVERIAKPATKNPRPA